MNVVITYLDGYTETYTQVSAHDVKNGALYIYRASGTTIIPISIVKKIYVDN